MAGRPLSAPLHENRDGTVTVRLPASPGSKRRVTERFPNTEVGERWRAAALAARKAGLALPDPEPYRAAANRRAPEELLDGFADVAWAWWQKFYPSNSPNPQRVDDVASDIRLHLIPFFAPRVDHISNITYEHCEDFVDFMSGARPKRAPKHAVVAEARELTLADAAAWCHKSKSAVRKAWLTGKFPNGYLDTSRDVMGVVRIPIGDLINADYVPGENAAEVPIGYSKKQVGALLSELRQICEFAMGKRLLDKDPSIGIKAKDPVRGARVLGPNSKSTSPVYMFDLVASKRIASRLHIHHQMTFWLLRCVGLRISEAYGIALEDIYRYEGEMTIRIWRQGGKNFKVADEEGNKRIVKSKTTVKTLASQRVLPIARPVAELIDRYIEAFHDGETDLSTPLLRTARGAGQSGFRDALQKATIAAGCGVEDVGFAVTPHTHRKFFATDLDDISPRPRSVYMGHYVQNLDGGAAITESTYTVKRKGVEHVLVFAKTMTSLIESSIVSLVEPVTASHLLPASACPDYDEREHALEVFDAAGFIGITAVDGEEVVEVAEAAALLGLGERKVVELARDGLLVRQRIAGAGRSSLFGVTVTSVQEHMSLAQQSWSRKKICLEFSLAYHQVDYLIKALGVVAYEAPASRGYRYLDSEVDKIRRYLEEKAEALRNAVSLAEVMDELSCSRRTATHLISIGRLELDATTTAAAGFTMVTRNSLARLRLERSQRRMLPEERPLGSIPIREAQVRAGLDRAGVLGLKTEDVVILRTADYQFHVDEVSLQAYLNRR